MNKQIKQNLVCLLILATLLLSAKLYYFKRYVEPGFDGVIYGNLWGDYNLYSKSGRFICHFNDDSPYPSQLKQIADDKWEIVITGR